MDIRTHKKDVLKWALEYAEKGWFVFPIHSVDENGRCSCLNPECPDPGKHPKTTNGQESATIDSNIIRHWFSEEAPLSNIGIATGANSSITVIDLDVGKKDGTETWAALNTDQIEPETLVSLTGSGGYHLVFIYNSAIPTKTDCLGPGIDVRNDGGYIIAPPSIHKSGRNYRWDNWGAKIASIPAHLIPSNIKNYKNKVKTINRNKFTIEQIKKMLKYVSSDNRDMWRNVGIILGREYERSDEAWQIYVDWSSTWNGSKGPKHDSIMKEAFYELSKINSDKKLTIATILKEALTNGWIPDDGRVPIDSFLYYAPGNSFIYKPTSEFWSKEAVDSTTSMMNDGGKLVTSSQWLKKNKVVTSMTSDPDIVGDCENGFDCRDGKLIPTQGGCVYNAYRPTILEPGDPEKAKPFVEHIRTVFPKPGDADQFLDYLAHRVQNPGEKPRFALLIAGEQGVGKDTAINMAIGAIGQWNVSNVSPTIFDGQFNEHAAKVLVIINETASTQEMSKWAFNEKTKVLIAGQPDYMTINPKYGHKYTVRLHCGVIITTNHMHAIYIPPDDRRYDVIEAATREEMGIDTDEKRDEYFTKLWGWFYNCNGESHIYSYLLNRSLDKFDASLGQRKTKAHAEIRILSISGDEWLLDALDELERPNMLTTDMLWTSVEKTSNGNITNSEFRVKIKYALKRAGYERLINANDPDGRFKLNCVNRKSTVYFNKDKMSYEEANNNIENFKNTAANF